MAEPFFKISDSWADLQAVFPSGAPRRNALNGVTFLLVMQGHGTVEIDHREFALREGLLLTVLPYHLLQMKASEGLKCRLLAFEFEYLSAFPFLLRSQLSEKIEAMPAVLLGKEARRLLVKHYDAIAAHHLRSSHASYREIMQALLFIWVAEINEIYLHKPLKPIATSMRTLPTNSSNCSMPTSFPVATFPFTPGAFASRRSTFPASSSRRRDIPPPFGLPTSPSKKPKPA